MIFKIIIWFKFSGRIFDVLQGKFGSDDNRPVPDARFSFDYGDPAWL